MPLLIFKGTFRKVYYLSEAPSPHMTLYSTVPLPLHTVYVFTYTILYLLTQGRGGELIREKVRRL